MLTSSAARRTVLSKPYREGSDDARRNAREPEVRTSFDVLTQRLEREAERLRNAPPMSVLSADACEVSHAINPEPARAELVRLMYARLMRGNP
jgi:uncharacterized sporulation protein YeaH/YhbH (DUF444 family)